VTNNDLKKDFEGNGRGIFACKYSGNDNNLPWEYPLYQPRLEPSISRINAQGVTAKRVLDMPVYAFPLLFPIGQETVDLYVHSHTPSWRSA
jgi:hypothetical protein